MLATTPFIITEKDDSLYFKLFQNEKYPAYINPSLELFPHFSANFNLSSFILAGFHDGDTLMSLGFAGNYLNGWGLSYIDVNPLYQNKGLGKKTFEMIEGKVPEKMKISGFTPSGFLYLRPFLLKKGYNVKNKVDYWPSGWDWNKISEWEEKNLRNSY